MLKRYACKYLDHRNALKRRPPPGSKLVGLDDLTAVGLEPGVDPEERDFDADWVKATVREALATLRAKNARYADAIEREMAWGGDNAAPLQGPERVLRHRARNAFREHFQETLRSTVMWDAFLAEEWVAIDRLLP